MSLSTPTTQQLADDIVSQIESAIAQSVPLLPKSFTRVLSKALAGGVVLCYKYAGFSLLQLFVAHATMRETVINGKVVRPLVEWGRLFGVGDPNPAQRAEVSFTVTVTQQTGSLPARSQLVRSETGVVYQSIADVPLDAPTITVNTIASDDPDNEDGSGAVGNLQPGDIVSFANTPPNVADDAVTLSTTVAGADAELEETYRTRIIRKVQAPPQGGAYADYRDWAEEVDGIVAAYPYTGSPGEIDVYVEATEASSGSADGIPTAGQLTAVLANIELNVSGQATRRPVNAAVNALAISRSAIDVTLYSLAANDLTAVQTDIEQGLDEYLRTREPYIVGVSVLPRKDRITQAAVAGIVDGIVSAAGGSVSKIALGPFGSEIVAHTLLDGEKAKLGTVTYA